jgi:ABC-2 type transport system ATP-binding protein
MIDSRALSKRFGEFTAVQDASFEMPAGAICALLGPNGAGKSTLLKMLTGLLAPTSGEAIVCGEVVCRESLALKRKIGVLPENLALFEDLTVDEHLELSGPVYGLTGADTRARADGLLRLLGLQNGRDTFLSECSYGMRKKTALAMALLHNPRVLFLDEPFEGIDPVTAQSIRELLRNVAARGLTVLLSSHILSLVDRVADRILMIRQGRIVWNSPTAELPRSLEQLYFDLVESPAREELAWLGS